jgi:hypothetical protein
MVILDTIDALCFDLVMPGMTEEYRGHLKNAFDDITDFRASDKGSKGWNMVTQRLLSYPSRLWAAGYGWFVNGHQRMRGTSLGPAVNPGVYGGLYRAAEFVTQTTVRVHSTAISVPKTLANGQVIHTKTMRTALEGQLEVQRKLADSDTKVEVGGNFTLESPIILPIESPWAHGVVPAWNAAVSAQLQKNENLGAKAPAGDTPHE